MLDYILNGQAVGSVAGRMMQCNFDPGVLRPWIGRDGRSYVSVNGINDGQPALVNRPLANAAATFLRDEWKAIDTAVIRAAGPRLRAWSDLRNSNSYTIPQGMGKTVLESMTAGDITPAQISMDGIRIADQDRFQQNMVGVPLPIIHKDFKFSARHVMVSRNGGLPLDTTSAELAARKVAEEIEKLTIGVGVGYQFAGYSLYGYMNFPGRLTHTLTDPTDVGWTPATLVTELIQMKGKAQAVGYYGPYVVYLGSAWDVYLDADYSPDKGDNTLRSRIMQLDGISSIRTLDYMSGFDILMVQMTPDVARAVVALDLTTLQWEQMGGMEICLKVMAIMVPQLRADFYDGTGIVHGAVA